MQSTNNDHPAIGIDLGTTFSVLCRLDDLGRPQTLNNAEGDKITPSVVFFEGENVVVGKEAVKALATDAERVAECAKRDLGSRFFHQQLGGRRYPPEAIQAWVLNKLRVDGERQLGPFRKAVITVPAYFDEVRRKATMDAGYIAGRDLATVLYLALKLERPLFVEGEPGTGKTEIAKVLSATLGRRLIRLQCYEGLDVSSAVYEWNYAGQMTAIRLAELQGQHDRALIEGEIFSDRFLIKRPLLQALEPHVEGPPVLLIDELDRADEPFEAFLLEVLADFQVSIPELGLVKAARPPIVVITSNRTREIHDALKRRCFYYWVDYPDAERELAILKAKAPDVPAALSREIVAFVQALRKKDLFKLPGVAETIDWGQALAQLDVVALDAAAIGSTLGALLKYQDDIQRLQGSEAAEILRKVSDDYAGAIYRVTYSK